MATRTLTARQRLVSLCLALLGNLVPVLVAVLDHLGTHPVAFFVGAAVGTVAPFAAFATTSSRLRVLRSLLHYLGIFGLVAMQAGSGGAGSHYAVLMVMPAIWYGSSVTGWDRRIGVTLIAASCWLPMLVPGPSAYPRDVGAATVLMLVLLGLVGSLAYYSSEVARLTTELVRDATVDRLTGLLNRRGWESTTAEAVRTAGRAPVCVAILDLDGLKKVNDTMGHDAGDRLLTETGLRLGDAFGSEAALARLGGDEFALLVVGSRAADVLDRLARLGGSTPERGAFSAGLAELTPGEELGDGMRRADLALYEVKTTGRGRAALADAPVTVEGSLQGT